MPRFQGPSKEISSFLSLFFLPLSAYLNTHSASLVVVCGSGCYVAPLEVMPIIPVLVKVNVISAM